MRITERTTSPLFTSALLASTFVALSLNVSGQTSAGPLAPATAHSSEGTMEGVNLQRTGVYYTKAVHQFNGLLWKSAKLFEINYAAALTPAFDNSLNFADIGFSEPVVRDGLIYFQLCISLNQNFIVALDLSTGRRVWAFMLKDALSAPAITDDSVYTVSADGNVYVLDNRTGVERWKYSSKDQQWNVYSSPAVINGMVYLTSLSGNLFALDSATRQAKSVFKSKEKKDMLSAPAFDNDLVYIASERGVLHAVDLQTCQEKWNFKAKGRLHTPIVANGSAYFRTEEGNLYAIDTKTGQQEWMVQIGGRVQPVFPVVSVKIGTSLAFYDSTIFFAGSEKGTDYLFAIDAQNGQQRWKFKVDGPCRSPIVADGVIYLGSLGNFYAVDAKTGMEKWVLRAKSEFHGKSVKNVASSPAVVEATVFFVTDEGFFYAVR